MADGIWQNLGGNGGGGDQGGGGYSGDFGGYQGGSSYQGGFDWNNFNAMRNQINQAVQNQQWQGPTWQQSGFGGWNQFPYYNGDKGPSRNIYARNEEDNNPFSMNGGTERLFNGKYREANLPETLAVGAGQVGELLNNLPGNIAGGITGLIGGDAEKAKQDWTFNADNFNPMNGIDVSDAAEVGKFALSLPGMIPGGIFEGVEKGYEAATGTPIQEWRAKDGGGVEIADYQLDTSQRAAAGVDAAINVLGTFTGGAGRLVGAAGKKVVSKGVQNAIEQAGKGLEKEAMGSLEKAMGTATKTDSAMKALDNMSKGWITRAGEAAMGKPAETKVLQTAFDMGDEAAEEFVQSYADDVRMKNLDDNSFDRALTGAAWGAVGGGLMKVGANIINSKTQMRSQNADDTEVSDPTPTNSVFERERQRTTQSGNMVASAAEEFADRASRLAKLDGSASGISTQVTKDIGNHEIGIGVDTLMGIWENGEASQTRLCEAFGVEPQVLQNIYDMHDSKRQAAAIQQIIDERGANNPVYVIAGRNPDTGISAAKMGIKNVFEGSGVQLSRMAYKMFGADVDGDRTQIYFNGNAQNVGFLPANFINQTTGERTVDWDYAAFYKDAERLTATLNRLLSPILDEDTEARLSQKYRDATNPDYLEKNPNANQGDMLASFFDTLYSEVKKVYINRWKANHPNEDISSAIDESNGRRVLDEFEWATASYVSNVYSTLENEATMLPSVFAEVVETATKEEQEAADNLRKNVSGVFSKYLRKGDIEGAQNFANICAQLGYKINSNTLYKNPFFRQAGQHYYESHEDWRLLEGVSPSDITSIFTEVINFSFRLEETGGDVETALEGIWLTTLQDEVMYQFHSTGASAITSENLPLFIETFSKVYNQLAPKFNKAYIEATTQGERAKYASPVKDSIAAVSQEDVVNNHIPPDVRRQFYRAFRAYRVKTFASFSEEDPTGLMTIEGMLKEAHNRPGGSRFNEFGDNVAMRNIMSAMLADYNGEEAAVGSRIMDHLSEISSLINEINRSGDLLVETTLDDGTIVYRVSDENMPTMTRIVDMFNRLISAKILNNMAIDMGETPAGIFNMFSVEGFVNSRWGRALLSGNTEYMSDAIGSILLSYQYGEVMDQLSLYQETGDEKYLNRARNLAFEISERSGGLLQTNIALELCDLGTWSMLQEFTDLDISHNDKNDAYAHMRGDDESRGTWLVDAFKIEGEEMSLSAITERLNKSKSVLGSAKRAALAVCRDEVAKIKRDFKPKQIFDAAKLYADESNVEFSSDALASFVFSNKHIVKQIIDKGTTTESSSALHQMLAEATRGGNYSFIDQIGNNLGIVSIDNFASNRIQILRLLLDPDAVFTFNDNTIDDRRTFTHKSFYEALLGARYSGAESPSEYDFLNVLDMYPQLVTVLSPQKINVSQAADGSSVSAGPSITFYDAISNSIDNDSAVRNADKVAKNKIKIELMTNPNWWGYLIASSPELMDSPTLKDTKYKTEKAIDRHVNFMLALTKLDKEGDKAKTAIENYYDGVFGHVFEQIFDSYISASSIRQIMKMSNSINNEVLDNAAKSMFGSLIVSKMNERFGLDLRLPFDDVFKNNDEISTSLKRIIEQNPQNFIDMFEAMISLFDPNETTPSHAIMPNNVRSMICSEIDSITERINNENLSDDELKDLNEQLKAMRLATQSIDSGATLMQLLGFNDMQSTISDDLIKYEDFTDLDSDAIKDKVLNILTKYGNKEEFDKDATDGIEKAWNNRDRKAQKRILGYYNNIVLSRIIKNTLQGSGTIVNADMAYQEINAQRELLEMADKIRGNQDIMNYVEKASAPKDVPLMRFHYGDRALSYMATSATFNAQAGSTGTGIGIDGAMMKAIAAYGLISHKEVCNVPADVIPTRNINGKDIPQFDTDKNGLPDYRKYDGCHFTFTRIDEKTGEEIDDEGYVNYVHWRRMLDGEYGNIQIFMPDSCNCTLCKNHAPKNPSRSSRKINPMAGVMEVLSNWMQEDRHLRRKKSIGVAKMLLGNTSDHPELRTVYNKDDYVSYPDQVFLRSCMTRTKKLLVDFYANTFEAEDKLPLSRKHAQVIANSTMPYIEVYCVDGASIRISTNILHDSLPEDEGVLEKERTDPTRWAYYEDAIAAHGGIKSAQPAIVSIDEMANKILRGTVPKYQNAEREAYGKSSDDENYGKVSLDNLYSWSWNSMNDWSAYNEEKITADQIMRRITARSSSFDTPMVSDVNPTAVMRFHGKGLEYMTNLNVQKETEHNYMSDKYRKIVVDKHQWLVSHGLVEYRGGSGNPPYIVRYIGSTLDKTGGEAVIAENLRNLTSSYADSGTDYDINGERCAELFQTSDLTRDIEKARNAWREAKKKDRLFIVKQDVAESIGVSNLVMKSAHTIVFKDPSGNGETSYLCLDPRVEDYFRLNYGRIGKMSISNMDPKSIIVAMFDDGRLGITDGGHYGRQGWQPVVHDHNDIRIKMSQLFKSNRTSPIDVVSTYDEMPPSNDEEYIDYSYYINTDIDTRGDNERKGRNGRSLQSYKDAVNAYLNKIKDSDGNPRIMNDARQGDCVGFAKQLLPGGGEKWAPLFFEGSVPTSTTVNLVVADDERGNIGLVYNTLNVEYSGPNAQKLDTYGIAYKSVGREAGDEQMKSWPAYRLGKFVGYFSGGGPEVVYDRNAMLSRSAEMHEETTIQNLFFFTQSVGSNLFYNVDSKGNFKKNPVINWEYFDKNPGVLTDLMNGDLDTWWEVAVGNVSIFAKTQANGSDVNVNGLSELNDIMSNLVSEILVRDGFPHIFFCPRTMRIEGENTNNPQFVSHDVYNMTYSMATQNFSRDQMLKLFHAIDPAICPFGVQNGSWVDDFSTVFDDMGRMVNANGAKLDDNGNPIPERWDTLIGPHFYTGEGTAIANVSREATFGPQHLLKRMLSGGVFPPNISKTMAFLGLRIDNPMGYFIKNKSTDDRFKDDDSYDTAPMITGEAYERARMVMEDPLSFASTTKYRRECKDLLEELNKPLKVCINIKNPDSIRSNDLEYQEVKQKYDDLNEALGVVKGGTVKPLSEREIMIRVRCWMGFTDNNGRGITSITKSQYIEAIDDMIKNVKEHGIMIMGGQYRGVANGVRVHIPLAPVDVLQRDMQFKAISDKFANLDEYRYELLQQLKEETMPSITQLKNYGQKNALRKFADAVAYANGYNTISGHVFDDLYLDDIIEACRKSSTKLEGYSEDLRKAYEERKLLSVEYLDKIEQLILDRHSITHDDKFAWGGTRTTFTTSDSAMASKVLRTLAQMRRTMGMATPMLIPANVGERVVNQGVQSAALRLGRIGIGPYRMKTKIDANVVHEASKDKNMIKIYAAYRTAQMVGAGEEMLMAFRNGGDIDAIIEEHLNALGVFSRYQSKFLNFMSGGSIAISGQIENFLWRFAQRAEDESPLWFMKVPGENGLTQTVFESELRNDPAKFFSNLMSANGSRGNADILLARQCMEWAKRGDMAQKTSVSAIITEFASRSAAADFALTAFISPYMNYSINRMGRVLQHIAPISSMYYLFTDYVTNGAGKNISIAGIRLGDMALEDAQFNKSLKEAMIIDAMHLGPQLIAFMLLGLAAMEPPDDEEKWGNFQEWTIFGIRVNAEWWIEDILGLAIPLACFGKSCELGKPRFDLIFNGLAHYIGNNPVSKVSDVVSILFDPFDELYKDYENNLEGYAKAMGGPPSMADIFYGKSTSMAASFVTQFCTPSFLREWYNDNQQWEKSYKRIYQESATGKLTEEGAQGKTQYTTYGDAMLRSITRKNPVMGWLCDSILHPNTSYMASGMPDTIIYDPDQMNSIEAFSLYKDPYTKKEEKSEVEKQAIALQVVSILMSSNNMGDLVASGFMLDGETKTYVSQFIWDQIATLNEEYYEREKNGELDYYVLGNGDFNVGKQIGLEIKQNHYDQIEYWKSVYYDKLWSDEMKQGVAQYRRYNTNYLQDANGDWYATGFHPTSFMPVQLAPEPSKTDGWKAVLGRNENWDTQSIVTGNDTGQRALVPVEIGAVQTPNIEAWSTDGTDTGHSESYIQGRINSAKNGNAANANGTDLNGKYPNYPSGSRRSYGGGGGGYGGGGGGRGYTPNIYSPNVNLPKSGLSKIMNTDRIYGPNEQYLRPDFETKGSREAYRRSDI